MRINNNIMAMNAHRQLNANNSLQGKSIEKLSSGLRINRAADDAAGLSISEKMRGQLRGIAQAQRNAQDGISLIQTAEGALTEVSDMLVRMKELYVQKSNGTYNSDDTGNIDAEITALKSEISNIASKTKFNDKVLLSGTTNDFNIQINHANGDTMKVTVSGIDSLSTGSLSQVSASIDQVASIRANLGAQQNRLEHTVNNLSATHENLQAAESRIRDTDMAKEMMSFTKLNILSQAAQSMLAQANMAPQGVLQLLG